MRPGELPANAYRRLAPDGLQGSAIKLGDRLVSTVTCTHREPEIIRCAFYRCVNELYAQGVSPEHMLVNIAFPEDYSEEKVELILNLLTELADAEKLELKAGNFMGTPFSGPVINLVCDGQGEIKKPVSGDTVIYAGYCAQAGARILAQTVDTGLKERMLKRVLLETERMTLRALKDEKCLVKPVAEGGALNALWDLKEDLGVGYNISLRDIPILQETVEMSENLGLNPYQLSGDGAAVIITGEPEKILEKMSAEHIPAAVIGQVSAEGTGLFFRGMEGSYIDRPAEDELFKFIRGVK